MATVAPERASESVLDKTVLDKTVLEHAGLEKQSDPSLLARMSEGDVDALAELYRRHSRSVYALTRAVLHNSQEAEDLTHDVFIEAWRRCDEYSVERGSVRAWLFMRARSRALDRLKAAGRSGSVGMEPVPRATPTSLVDRYRLRERLINMPEPQRQVLLLGYFEGMSTIEIADRLGIPPGTVKSRTRAALVALRQKFGVAG